MISMIIEDIYLSNSLDLWGGKSLIKGVGKFCFLNLITMR